MKPPPAIQALGLEPSTPRVVAPTGHSREITALDLAADATAVERAAAAAAADRDMIKPSDVGFLAPSLVDSLPTEVRRRIARLAAFDAHVRNIRKNPQADDRSWIITGRFGAAVNDDPNTLNDDTLPRCSLTADENAEFADSLPAVSYREAIRQGQATDERLLLFKTNAHGNEVPTRELFCADGERGAVISHAPSIYALPRAPIDPREEVSITEHASENIPNLRYQPSTTGHATMRCADLVEQAFPSDLVGPCIQVELGSSADQDLGLRLAADLVRAIKRAHTDRNVTVSAISRSFARKMVPMLLAGESLYGRIAHVDHCLTTNNGKREIAGASYTDIIHDGEPSRSFEVTGAEDLVVTKYEDLDAGTVLETYGTDRRIPDLIRLSEAAAK